MPSCETLDRLVSLTGRMGKMSGGGTICTGSEGVWQVERELGVPPGRNPRCEVWLSDSEVLRG